MSDVIKFPPPKQDEPDANCVTIVAEDGAPVNWFKFGLTYTDCDEDKTYGLEIWARDQADAERRVRLLRETAKLEGQIFAQIPWD